MATQQEMIAYIENNWNTENDVIKNMKRAYDQRNDTAFQQLVKKIIEQITGTFTTPVDMVKKIAIAVWEWLERR
jgi:hemerythrin